MRSLPKRVMTIAPWWKEVDVEGGSFGDCDRNKIKEVFRKATITLV